MDTKLRALQLPLLVEERRKTQEFQDGYYAYTASSVDSVSSDAITAPATPTSSPRGHLRYPSSTSSELSTPATSNGPSSPTQSSQKAETAKSLLPDVEEESLEAHDSDSDCYSNYDDTASDHFDLDYCLCDEPCIHHDADLVHSTTDFYTQSPSVDYDFGFLSDGDLSTSAPNSKKRSGSAESTFAGLTQRFGSRFPPLTRWKSKRNTSLTQSPTSDYGFDQRSFLSRATSRAPSSRSSSLSASYRFPREQIDIPLPPTPALSYYESSESITTPSFIDVEKANAMAPDIERERALATTPLLPPSLNSESTGSVTAAPSPLESPAIAPAEPPSPLVLSPPLSSKPSNSSFHRIVLSAELPHIPAPDAWSDRLGHANFTIEPQPYIPAVSSLEALRQLKADWDTARVNYTKHLARTGEHYGTTSKTYAMTEAKWAETDSIWRAQLDTLAEAVLEKGTVDDLSNYDRAILTTLPRMDAEGKFPDRGDEDIVGPMVREEVMIQSPDLMDRRGPSFWRNLAGRVGLKK